MPSVLPPPADGGPDSLDGDPQLVGGLDQRIQRLHTAAVGRPPPGCRRPTYHPGPYHSGEPRRPSGPRWVWSSRRGRPERGRSPPRAHTGCLREGCSHCRTVLGWPQPGDYDLAGPLAVPASNTMRGRQNPVGRCVAAGREPAQGALLFGFSRCRAGSNGGMGGGSIMVASQGGREQTEHSTTYRI